MSKYLILLLGLAASALAQTASLNLVSSNTFNRHVDVRVTKPTNGIVANQLVGVKTGATNLEYKTLVAGTGTAIVHTDTNITFNSTLTFLLPDGSVGAPALTFSNANTSGIYLIDTNTFGFSARGTNHFQVGLDPSSGQPGATATRLFLEGKGEIDSGTYIPTTNDFVNITAVTPSTCQYMRVGYIVTVSGQFTVDAIAGGGTDSSFNFSLPLASVLTGSSDVSGVMTVETTGGRTYASVVGDTGSNDAIAVFDSNSTTPVVFTFLLTYRIN